MGTKLLRMRWIGVLALTIVWTVACSPQKVSFEPANGGDTQSSTSTQQPGTQPGSTTTPIPTPMPTPAPSTANPGCTTDISKTNVLTKMLFIVDTSGSNQGSSGCKLGSSCTDPGKQMRSGSIDKFFDDYGSRSNFQWNVEYFQDTYANSLINGFGNGSAMQAAMSQFMTIKDQGQTPYLAALSLAENTIKNDPDLNSSLDPQYLIVFMSDGQPTDTDATGAVNEVRDIVGLSPGKITFNTVYYGAGAATEAGLVQSMAQAGNGHFLNTNTNPTGLDFEIQDVINVPCP